LLRRRAGVLERLLHVEGEPVVVRAAQAGAQEVTIGSWSESVGTAREGLERMRFALGVDDDLRPFHERFRWDPLIGPLLRRDPGRRVGRRPDPFEALAWAVCAQLIESGRAREIQRRLVTRLGTRCPISGLRDSPGPAALVAAGAARLEGCGLSPARALSLVRVSTEVARGRIDLRAPNPERGWARLRALRGIGPWTVEMLALRGQGRLDQVPAGDLGLLKALGFARTGNPRARAEIEEVRELFARYDPYGGVAASYVLGAGRAGAEVLRAGLMAGRRAGTAAPVRAPARAGTRWSGPARRRAAA
jgi:3-methyladenine DNA glycosylase/8-oxoguanine DNA glycosylase